MSGHVVHLPVFGKNGEVEGSLFPCLDYEDAVWELDDFLTLHPDLEGWIEACPVENLKIKK